MLDLVHLRECAFTHLLERAYLVRIGFASEVDGTVAALTDLSDDPELVDTELGSPLAKEDTLATIV